MNKKNIMLLLLIAALVISNGVLLWLYMGRKDDGRGPRDRRGMMKEQLRREVGFDTAQLAAFEKISGTHTEKIHALFDSMRVAREALFNQMGRYQAGDSALQPVVQNIARQQQRLDLQVYANLGEIRKICTPAQLPGFDSLARKIMLRMGGGGRRKGPDPEKK